MLKTTLLICSKPGEAAARCLAERDLEPLLRVALLVIVACTGAFGLVLGNTRDVEQALATALKLPLVWVLTLAVCAPAFHAIAAALGHGLSLRSLLALILVATARASMVLFALLPALWLLSDFSAGRATHYHEVTLTAALIYGVAGLAALGVLLRAFPRKLSTGPVLAGFALTFFVVAGQTAWSLRPFVGRPAEKDSPWLRAPEGTFVEAVWRGSDSARGIYHRAAPLPVGAELEWNDEH